MTEKTAYNTGFRVGIMVSALTAILAVGFMAFVYIVMATY